MSALWICLSAGLAAQAPSSSLRVEVRSEAGPLAGADVIVAGRTYRTGADGMVTVSAPPGPVDLTVASEGFVPVTQAIEVPAAGEQRVLVELRERPTIEEEVLVVASTRTNRGLEDQPLRVDVLPREEIEEKMLMTPGDIVMMMNEMGGMRVQATSPSLGAASVRVQGMRGRYTRVLSDGLPLFGEVGGLGLLQIPPMDLAQVEVIKGVASSMYGAGAMGGVVNLISRRPGAEPIREFLLNRSTRGATDAVAFVGAPVAGRWAVSLLGGGHWQQRADVDEDGWSDLPRYARLVLRPRVHWDGADGRSVFATSGITVEDRAGGTAASTPLPAAGVPYQERLDTRRVDAGVVAQLPVRERFFATARAAFSRQRHTHVFGERRERDRHHFAFGEVAIRGSSGRHAWAAGAALEHDSYRAIDLPRFSHSFTIPGVFVQDDVEVSRWMSLSASGRVDHHSEYGTFVSPRLAILLRAGRWTSRLSGGTGFVGPSALTEETEAAGLSRLTIREPLRAEEGRSASFDLTRSDGPFTYTGTLFASRVEHPLRVERTGAYVLGNAAAPTRTAGAELLGTFRREPLALTVTYAYVRAREHDDAAALMDAALTPRHSAGVVGIWEREDAGRVGVEVYYTGVQRLEENPFAGRSRRYVILGLLGERQVGRFRLFVNGENLTGVRQTRWQPLLRAARAADGRWTVDAWAPLDGRTVNGGLRLRF